MRQAPKVQPCYSLAGERDYLIVVVANGMSDYRDTVDRLFMDDDNAKKYTTHIVFDVVKTGLAITTATGNMKGDQSQKSR